MTQNILQDILSDKSKGTDNVYYAEKRVRKYTSLLVFAYKVSRKL